MNNPNGSVGNPNRDNFEKMMQLAEFGAKRHDERRQVEFRVFIAYITLLSLAFYQISKIEEINSPNVAISGLILVHFIYLLWQIRLSRALVNDAWRRNFYLKKAECILDHLQKNPDDPFHPRKDVCVTISLGLKKDEMSEYELFDMHEPNIVLVSPMLKFWKHWGQIFSDWSRLFETLIPTVMLPLLIIKLVEKKSAFIISVILMIVLFVPALCDIVIKKRNDQ
jgi:hypothetical protein